MDTVDKVMVGIFSMAIVMLILIVAAGVAGETADRASCLERGGQVLRLSRDQLCLTADGRILREGGR